MEPHNGFDELKGRLSKSLAEEDIDGGEVVEFKRSGRNARLSLHQKLCKVENGVTVDELVGSLVGEDGWTTLQQRA